MPYQLQKCATWRHFQRFLRRLPGQPTEMCCTADHVVTYLISADSRGRTIVHSMGCRRPLSPPCSCPIRLAFKTVDSTIGRLRSAFNDLGRERQDNPAAARVVKNCLKDVTNERLMVELVPEQAIHPGILSEVKGWFHWRFWGHSQGRLVFFASHSFERGQCSYLRWSPSNGGSSWGRQGRNLLCASQTTVGCSSTTSLGRP